MNKVREISIIKTAFKDYRKKLEKQLEKLKKQEKKAIQNSTHLPPRTKIRGGRNTTLIANIEKIQYQKKIIQEQINFLKVKEETVGKGEQYE